MSKHIELPPNGVDADKLIVGNAYKYLKGKKADEDEMVLYQRIVRLPNDKIAYNFRLTGYCGFVNLLEDDVKRRIYPLNN